jgi:hypothetical protein
MGKGQTFLGKEEQTGSGLKRHLNIVITEPDEDQNYLVVPVTTWHDGYRRQDDSCILPAGAHAFITHKSWVNYARAKQMSYTEIFNGIRKGYLIAKVDIAAPHLQDIQKGAVNSPYFPEKLNHFLEFFG